MTQKMPESVSAYKSIVFLVTCAVLAHFAIEPVLGGGGGDGVGNDDSEQFSSIAALDKSNYEPFPPHKRPSFFVGSRYGRSGAALSSSKIRRLNVVPRNDRFFLGSRYGKRAEGNSAVEPFLPYAQQQQQQNPKGIDDAAVNGADDLTVHERANGGGKKSYDANESLLEKQKQQQQQQQQQSQLQSPSMMSCIYIGYRNYYRCRNIEEINNIINQLTVAQSVEERK